MAAINGRRWLGIDISKEYVDIAKKRMEVAEQMIRDGYTKDYTPEEKKEGLTRKDVSAMKKKDLIDLVMKLNNKEE